MTEPLIHRYEPTDPRLGRRVFHDPRSLAYARPVLPKSAIQTVEWTRRIPILDQGQLGSCTGNAITGWLGTDGAGRTGLTSAVVSVAGAAASHGNFAANTYPLDEAFAVKAYSLATDIDSYPGQYPPTDTGSDGLSVTKGMQLIGLVGPYTHAFTQQAMDSALQSGPVIIGIEWLNSMFSPASDGTLTVNQSSGVAGGHEIEVVGLDVAASGNRYKLANSWGTSWGNAGYGYVAAADMAWLLSQQGDVTVPVAAAPPAPPQPPAPVVDDATLWATAKAWAAAKGLH